MYPEHSRTRILYKLYKLTDFCRTASCLLTHRVDCTCLTVAVIYSSRLSTVIKLNSSNSAILPTGYGPRFRLNYIP